MKLGILITTNKHLQHVIGIARAASAKGHEVSMFAMDAGTRLLLEADFVQLCGVDNLSMSLCNHSATEQGVDTSGITKEIVIGSQFNNAMMNNQADRVIVF